MQEKTTQGKASQKITQHNTVHGKTKQHMPTQDKNKVKTKTRKI